ncbi:MAG: DUF3159 domain-containing protein [Micrococcales bacterium]|nr:DUF3159 domain-containing protein [Micrococcales bacterium]
MNQPTGWRALLAEEFNWSEAMGGPRGMAESVAPGLTFVICFVIWQSLWPALIPAVALASVLAVVRLIQRGSVMGAVSGLGGIGVGAIWAAITGQPQDVYAWGLWVNGAYGAGSLLTIVFRFPLVAMVVAVLTFRGGAVRADADLMRRSYQSTWLLVAMFAARLAVQLPLYFGAKVALLGTVKLAMGFPLFALVLWLCWLIMRPALAQAKAEAAAKAETTAAEAAAPIDGALVGDEAGDAPCDDGGATEPGETDGTVD